MASTSRCPPALFLVAILLFGSGLSALVYQTVWFRQFRLIFGASTAATAAVLAMFMGGLGLGGLWLGRRADRVSSPLRFYGLLEIIAAASAFVTPLMLAGADRLYVLSGGAASLGPFGATLVRLALSAAVLAIPTIAMGASLPAASRAVETDEDVGRGRLAILYGMNTLGAVLGVGASTFYLLEHFGNRRTIWLASGLNLIVGATALVVDAMRGRAEVVPEAVTLEREIEETASTGPTRFVLVAAAATGFVFFLMELVWYRMLTPLLGGTTFTFGLILGVALAGIGAGGALYSFRGRGTASTMGTLAVSFALEGLFIAIPWALGDRLALVALQLRSLAPLGFGGLLIGWGAITCVVVLPAAIVSGYQFPVLISLLGTGRASVGSQVGMAYAANTAGAITGALAGGFGLMTLLSARGSWLASTGILLATSLGALTAWIRVEGMKARAAIAMGLVAVAVGLLFTTGPTAFWRHTPIGAGRATLKDPAYNDVVNFVQQQRRILRWERDGVESSIALTANRALAFVVNGKIDGNARFDAGTQVMGGLIGAILHPNPASALVIGLGTGSTAGWLGAIPSMERVDVVELEPVTVEVARACAEVNQRVLDNDKVRIQFGDAREALRVSRDRYDIIFSEPSNPYRAGIASLYTVEYYEAVEKRLAFDGVFLQWLQAYEIDGGTFRNVYASLRSVFPVVETWQTQVDDLVLVGRRQPVVFDAGRVRARLAQEPYRSALRGAWLADDAEGFFAHYIAGSATAAVLARGAEANTDDRTLIEFSFGRTVGEKTGFGLSQLRRLARVENDARPPIDGELDWRKLAYRQLSMAVPYGGSPYADVHMDEALIARARALDAFARGNYGGVMSAWATRKDPPDDAIERIAVADAMANLGDSRAMTLVEELRETRSIESMVIAARFLRRKGRAVDAANVLAAAYEACRVDPWTFPAIVERSFGLAYEITREDGTKAAGRRLFEALSQPFVAMLFEERRIATRFSIATALDGPGVCSPNGLATVEAFEPHVPWSEEFLARRATCYQQLRDSRAAQAVRDLERFRSRAPVALSSMAQP